MLVFFMCSFTTFAQKTEASSFKAGAAKVNITPKVEDLPAHITGICDNLNVRAVVVDNGITSAALISVDIAAINDNFWEKYTQRIEKELGIPAANIFIAPSHSHSSIFLPMGNSTNVDPKIAMFTSIMENGIINAVKQAKANLQPARVGFGTGTSYLNVNRDAIDPVTRLWTQAPNYEGVSDKTVAVVKFETLTGKPIAVYYNYAMHANSMFMSGAISADFPGETSKYVEDYYNNKIVALFSSGAAGDQNPISVQPLSEVADIKTNYALSSGKAKDLSEAIMMGASMDVQVDPKLLARQAQMITSMGQLLGEEIIRTMKLTQRTDTQMSIYSSQNIVTCPGRKRIDTGRQGTPGTYVDGDPVNIRLSLLMLGDIAFAGVDAEVYNLIAQRLKKESPFANTIFSSITNGMSNSGYIPSDDAFVRYTFQVLSSSLQPGCAEGAIVNGLLDMMDKVE